jgi:hypothetical protein
MKALSFLQMWHLPLKERIKYDEWLSKRNGKTSNLSDWGHFLAQPFKPEIITEYFEEYPITTTYSLDEFIISSQQAGIELVFKEQDKLVKTINEDGTIMYELNGELHREDGPAYEKTDGYKEWHLYGKLHREDGPAVEYINGYKEWWLENIDYSEEEFNNIIKIYLLYKENKSTIKDCNWYDIEEQYRRTEVPAIEYPDGDKEY